MSTKRVRFISLLSLFFITSIFFKSSSGPDINLTVNELNPALVRSLLLTPEKKTHYRKEIEAILLKHHFRGNILLSLGGKIVYENSFGYADVNNRVPNNIHTVFQLASITKPFTGAAIAILKEQGKLCFDDLVVQHIPEFPYPDITIRHLLSHTSGLQNYIWLLDNYWDKPYFPNNEDLITLFAEHTLPQNFRTGQKYSYSNTGYAFLGSIIERVSGVSYGEFLSHHIFEPLNMHNTLAYDKQVLDTLSTKAHGHVRRGRRYVKYEDDNNDGILGDKGIYSTVHDLLKWDRALYSDVLLPYESIRELFDNQKTSSDISIDYGLGWRLPKQEYHGMVYHNGWWHGYRTTFRRYTDTQNTLIILNNTNINIFPMIKEIEDFIFAPLLANE